MVRKLLNLQYILYCLLICFLLLSGCSTIDDDYETNAVSDYGRIPNVEFNPNEKMQEAFSLIFPKRIEEDFQDVHYHYRAVNRHDEWTAEMYLEFNFDTEERFYQYVVRIAPLNDFTSFSYADGWYEYVWNDYFRRREEKENQVRLRGADIEKVLINPEELRVVHVALCSQETAVPVETLTEYFDRFQIDPRQYGVGPDDYETFQIKDYGFISGTTRGESARLREAFETVFPKKLSANVEVVRYHLKTLDCAHSRDTGEILLELQYEDTEQLFRAAETVAPLENYQKNEQATCWEYAFSSLYQLNERGEITDADMEKIVLLPNENRIVYVVLLMKDDSPIPAAVFCSYFNRFNIFSEDYG